MGIETKYFTTANEPKALGLTSASVGQIPKVKAVDSNGVPTEWEPVTMPSGGSGDMIYVLDIGQGEDNTFTINNDFDEAVTANAQGKIFVYGGFLACVSTSASNGVVNEIQFDINAGVVGYYNFVWNRGSATVTLRRYLFPCYDSQTLAQQTSGSVYWDASSSAFTIKGAAAASNNSVYLVQFDDNNVMTNDYAELETAIKNGSCIVIKDSDTVLFNATASSVGDSDITIFVTYSNLLFAVTIDKSTKKRTVESISFPVIDESSISGYIYYDKSTSKYSIKELSGGGTEKLKKLTFTGAATGEYDGTADVSVDIPVGVDNVYFVQINKDNTLANDYTEFINAVKAHKAIIIASRDSVDYRICIFTGYDINTDAIQCATMTGNIVAVYNFAKETKALTARSFNVPVIEDVSQSGSVYYDKTADKYSIKDATPPTATASTAGIIKVGNGLSISDDGTLSVTTATYYTGTSAPVDTLGADGDLYLQTEG